MNLALLSHIEAQSLQKQLTSLVDSNIIVGTHEETKRLMSKYRAIKECKGEDKGTIIVVKRDNNSKGQTERQDPEEKRHGTGGRSP